MLAKVRQLRDKVGHSLSLFVLDKYAGGADPEKIGHAKLTIVFEKLSDIGNGIDRVRRAAAVLGDAQYSVICRELNFASESIDDIPNRDALKTLLVRVEAEAAGKNGSSGTSGLPVSISDARGLFLQAARKAADKTRKRLADIIAEASDGKLSLDGLKSLTDADVPLVAAATARIA
jgi:hypothetical protein